MIDKWCRTNGYKNADKRLTSTLHLTENSIPGGVKSQHKRQNCQAFILVTKSPFQNEETSTEQEKTTNIK